MGRAGTAGGRAYLQDNLACMDHILGLLMLEWDRWRDLVDCLARWLTRQLGPSWESLPLILRGRRQPGVAWFSQQGRGILGRIRKCVPSHVVVATRDPSKWPSIASERGIDVTVWWDVQGDTQSDAASERTPHPSSASASTGAAVQATSITSGRGGHGRPPRWPRAPPPAASPPSAPARSRSRSLDDAHAHPDASQ